MGGMPGNVAKGPTLKRLEDWLNDHGGTAINPLVPGSAAAPRWQVFRDMWQNDPEQCLYFAENLKIGSAPSDTLLKYKELEHIKRDWLADPKAPGLEPDARHKLWWPQFYPIHRVFRAAFLKAYDLCWGGTSKKKIDFYWICAGSHLEMVLCDCQHANVVTFLILTPTVPIPRHDGDVDTGKTEPIWVATFDNAGLGHINVDRPAAAKGVVTSQLQPEKEK